MRIEQKIKMLVQEHGLAAASGWLRDTLTHRDPAKRIRPEDISIRGLAIALLGEQWYRSLEQSAGRGDPVQETVDSTTFANITGQIIYSKVLEGYMNPAFAWPSLVDVVPTQFDGERIPGVKLSEDKVTDLPVAEAEKFPEVGLSEDYVDTPPTEARGCILSLTKFAIFTDRTGQLLRTAAQVGERILGARMERRVLSMVLGLTNPFNWRGVGYNTYTGDAAGWAAVLQGVGGNLLTNNELLDWTDLDNALMDRVRILDPFTGEPILITPKQILVMPQKATVAQMLLGSPNLDYGRTGFIQQQFKGNAANPFFDRYQVIASTYAYHLLLAAGVNDPDELWIIGDFKAAFAYMQNWPLAVVQATQNAEAEFERNIVARWRVDERGVPAVLEPRAVTMCTG